MFNVDSPGFPIALLAILVGVRLIMHLYERLYRQAPASVATALVPDEQTEPEISTLAGSETSIPVAESTAPPQAVEEESTPYRFITELTDSGIIAVILVFFIIRPFILQAFFIPTGSMIPTLRPGDRLLAAKYVYHMREPKRGEVVVFHAPKLALEMQSSTYDPNQPVEYVKRVVGLPGNHVKIKRYDGVYIDGKRLNEPYIHDLPDYHFPLDDGQLSLDNPEARKAISSYIKGDELVVPEGYLFVLGDNRTGSLDSHKWGLLKRDRVIGKAFFIFWPLDRKGLIR